MRTRELFLLRLTPMPVVEPFPQNELSKGIQVHCSSGASIGAPMGALPPLPPVPVAVAVDVPAPPVPSPPVPPPPKPTEPPVPSPPAPLDVVLGESLLEQATRPSDATNE